MSEKWNCKSSWELQTAFVFSLNVCETSCYTQYLENNPKSILCFSGSSHDQRQK